MKDEVLERERISRIYSSRGFIPYPPKIEALLREKKTIILKIIYDFIIQKIKNKIFGWKRTSLEDWGLADSGGLCLICISGCIMKKYGEFPVLL